MWMSSRSSSNNTSGPMVASPSKSRRCQQQLYEFSTPEKEGSSDETPTPMSPSSDSYRLRIEKNNEELEQLRQLGLAKLLNKHFTETTRKIAEEKAAADAAIADLNAKKASNQYKGEFRAASHEMSELDKLYLQLNKQRADCRRKEKETLLLYQRYVDKFGKTGHVTVPGSGKKPPKPTHKAPRSGATSNSSLPTIFSPPPPHSPHGVVAKAIPAFESLLDDASNENINSTPNKDNSINDCQQDEKNSAVHFRKSDSENHLVAKHEKTPLAQSNRKSILVQVNSSNHENCQPLDSPTKSRRVSLDPPAKESKRHQPEHCDGQNNDRDNCAGDDCNEGAGAAMGLFKEVVAHSESVSDDGSVISGLTFNSAFTREIMHHAESRMADFLQNETENIRELLSDATDLKSLGHISHVEEEEDRGSLFSGSEVGSHSQRGADDAEDMVKKMQQILSDFSESSAAEYSNNAAAVEPRPIETSNPDELWVAYYDETYQRDYYVELGTNRTQWHPPEGAVDESLDDKSRGAESMTSSRAMPLMDTSMSMSMSTSLSHREVMPEISGSYRRKSRIHQYRKMRRRRRNRRLIIGALAVAAAAVGFMYLHQYNPSSLPDITPFNIQTRITDMDAQSLLDSVKDIRNWEMALDTIKLSVQNSVDVVSMKVHELLSTDLPSQDILSPVDHDEVETCAAETESPKPETQSLKAETQSLKAATEVADKNKDIDSGDKPKPNKKKRRPWGCNIPLSYMVNKGCRRLASDKPVFDLADVEQSIMQ